MSHTVSPEVNRMPSTYKQSFKQNYTDNVELSIFNCGLQSCEPVSYTHLQRRRHRGRFSAASIG